MYNFILFDLDGTLTDPKVGICQGVQYALKKYGIYEPDIDKLTPFIGPPLVDSFMEFYGFSKEQAMEACLVYREYFEPIGIFENVEYPGVRDMLKKLKESGRVLAIASSKPEVFVIRILKHFGIFEYFDVVTGSLPNETRTAKEEVMEAALSELGKFGEINFDSCVMVGDRKFDVNGGRTHNLTTVMVSYGYADEGEIEESAPDFVANNVEELTSILMR